MKSAILCALAVVAFSSPALAFSASFNWCSKMPGSTTSPSFRFTGTPSGTKSLRLQMTDHEAPNFNHGGGTVAYSGTALPCGAIPSGWVGPSPPEGAVHTYEFTVEALDGAGKTLATARATRKFPQ
jgi:phosphatidylethanolamine-binding protein (PEBP) family uncharacterized protein